MKLFHLTVSFFLVLLLSGCVTQTTSTTKPDTSVLRVGVSANSPPLIYKEGNNYTGLEVDFAKQLGTYLNKQIEFVEVPWKKQIEYLLSGKTDIIMSGMTITNERAYQVDFSLPYMFSGQLMLSKRDRSAKFSKGIYSLMNTSMVIGTIENTTGDFLITRTITKPTRKQYKKSSQAVKALINDEIDVFIYDAPMACHLAALNEKHQLTVNLELISRENLAWAVSKNNPDLLEQVNSFRKQLDIDEKREKTIKKWVPYM